MALARRRSVGCMLLRYGVRPARDFSADDAAPLAALRSSVKSQPQRLPGIANLRSDERMDDSGLHSALDRAERALQRIERALATDSRQPAATMSFAPKCAKWSKSSTS